MNLLIDLDDETAKRLEVVAPARSRKRSEFIRAAIRKALWELEELRTADAYRRTPDSTGNVIFDSSLWEAPPPATRRKARRRSR